MHGGAALMPRPTTITTPPRLQCCYSDTELSPSTGRKILHSQILETPPHRSRGMVSDSWAERGMAQRPRIGVYLHPSGTEQ